VTTPDADTLADLIADCAHLPTSLWPTEPQLPLPRLAPVWHVDDRCLAQVLDMDEFV
jgi:hypothetical protein